MSLMDSLKAYTGRIRSRQPSKMVSIWRGIPLELQVLEAPVDDAGLIGKSVADIWRTEPHLRTVVDYIATNVAQLGIHVFETNRAGDRDRVRQGVLANVFKRPNPNQTLGEFLRALVTQIALYSDSYVWVTIGKDGQPELRLLPNEWLTVEMDAFGAPKTFYAATGDNPQSVEIPADQVLSFPGWSPDGMDGNGSPVEALRTTLEEQYQARNFRTQIWKSAGRFNGYLTRPKDAPEWDDAARRKFYQMWLDFTGTNGKMAGANPLLEDGIEFKRTAFSAKEEQWAEATKLSLETVCQVYHVPPVMVGITDDANYSNVTAYSRQLYTNTLGSWIVALEQRFNTFLAPMIGAPPEQFVEFNVEAKLRGDFAEQYQILQTAVGAPILTRNEARRMLNYKPVEGADELITPLNVLEGGLASPTDGGEGRPEEIGGQAALEIVAKTADRLKRRTDAGGSVDWGRWVKEITQDLTKTGTPAKDAATIAERFKGIITEHQEKTGETLNGAGLIEVWE